MEIYVKKIRLFPYFVSFSCFLARFYHIAYIDFTRIKASSRATDDVTN